MTPEILATLHARCFTEAPRPWSVREFADLLSSPGTFLCPGEHGFSLGRVAGPEAELLTLAVAPEARRRGQGSALVIAFETAAAARAAETSFLEVSVENAPACALYHHMGYQIVGKRPGYYTRDAQHPLTALVMRKALKPMLPNA